MNSLNCSLLRQGGDTEPWILDGMWPVRISCHRIKGKFWSPSDERPNFGRNIPAYSRQSQPPRHQRETGHRKKSPTLTISKNKIIFLCCSNLIPCTAEFRWSMQMIHNCVSRCKHLLVKFWCSYLSFILFSVLYSYHDIPLVLPTLLGLNSLFPKHTQNKIVSHLISYFPPEN